MINMKPTDVARALGAELRGNITTDEELRGVVYDNRLIKSGYAFVAICGNRVDGHTFVNDAYKAGASLAIVEKDGDYDGAYIVVESTKKALGDIAAYYRRQLSIPIIGVIGSVGKTGTKEMIASVLSTRYNVLKTQGNYNNDLGLPITILSITEEHTAAVVEMGISDFGEMEYLSKIARPDMVVYTCIGECHLENLIDREGVFRAKTEVLDYLNDNAKVIINADDDKLRTIAPFTLHNASLAAYSARELDGEYIKQHPAPEIMYAPLEITDLGMQGTKVRYRATNTSDGVVEDEIIIPLPGVHNVSNAMAAISAGYLMGLGAEDIASGISNVRATSGRSNIIRKDGYTIIDDCYNANPMSMRAGLDILGKSSGRKIAVLGDMGELGNNEYELHRQLHKSIIDNDIDIVLTVGDLSKSIVEALEDTDITARAFTGEDAKGDLISYLYPLLTGGDTVLIKASHFMAFSDIVDAITGS